MSRGGTVLKSAPSCVRRRTFENFIQWEIHGTFGRKDVVQNYDSRRNECSGNVQDIMLRSINECLIDSSARW
jgi:hypothetical protein